MSASRCIAGVLLVAALVPAVDAARAEPPREPGSALGRPSPAAVPAAPEGPDEGPGALAVPRPGQRPAEPEAGEDEAWQGPRVELGYARYRFSDGHQGGGVNALQFGGYLPTGAARLGMYGELGMRDYSLEPSASDAIVRGAVLAGYQQLRGLGPIVPYAVAVGTGGVLFGKRYHTPVSHTIWGAGLELGADVRMVGRLWGGVAFSWIRLTMRDLSWDLVMLRLRIGL
ncbi:MAG: hypothetical protein ACODAU_05395 [Myxococcota bacterium]